MRKLGKGFKLGICWILASIFLIIFARNTIRLWRYDRLLSGKTAIVMEVSKDLDGFVLFREMSERLNGAGIIKKISLWYHNAVVAEVGTSSWYGQPFHGRITANGERYNMYAMTAAHRFLPFGTRILVTNLRNLKSVIVRVNDRGPYWSDRVRLRRNYTLVPRILDLSYAAANAIGLVERGIDKVSITVLP